MNKLLTTTALFVLTMTSMNVQEKSFSVKVVTSRNNDKTIFNNRVASFLFTFVTEKMLAQ